jgi:hypothetical protein
MPQKSWSAKRERTAGNHEDALLRNYVMGVGCQ